MYTFNFTPAVLSRSQSIMQAMSARNLSVSFSLVDNSDKIRITTATGAEVVEILPDIAQIIRENYKTKGTTTANNYRRLAALVLACRDLGLSFREYRWLRNQFN